MSEPGKILYAEQDGVHLLKFVGDVRLTLGPAITQFIEHLRGCQGFRQIVIDLKETQGIDSTALGLLARVAICSRESFDCTPALISTDPDITRILRSMAMDQVCHLVTDPAQADEKEEEKALKELPCQAVSEEILREEVLMAHKTLMSLDSQNQQKFQDLVKTLEADKAARRQARRRASA